MFKKSKFFGLGMLFGASVITGKIDPRSFPSESSGSMMTDLHSSNHYNLGNIHVPSNLTHKDIFDSYNFWESKIYNDPASKPVDYQSELNLHEKLHNQFPSYAIEINYEQLQKNPVVFIEQVWELYDLYFYDPNISSSPANPVDIQKQEKERDEFLGILLNPYVEKIGEILITTGITEGIEYIRGKKKTKGDLTEDEKEEKIIEKMKRMVDLYDGKKKEGYYKAAQDLECLSKRLRLAEKKNESISITEMANFTRGDPKSARQWAKYLGWTYKGNGLWYKSEKKL